LCAQEHGFNLHGATRVAANDKQGRLTLCKYILRPPLANDRLKLLDDDNVRLEFKKGWSDGTTSVELEPLALIARFAALVPPPKRQTVRYFGVLSFHATSRASLRLIALIKSEDIAKKILIAMHLPVDIPQLRPARPPPQKAGGDDWLN
jgi:hypothetical protein